MSTMTIPKYLGTSKADNITYRDYDGKEWIEAGGGNDTITMAAGHHLNVIDGGDGEDTLIAEFAPVLPDESHPEMQVVDIYLNNTLISVENLVLARAEGMSPMIKPNLELSLAELWYTYYDSERLSITQAENYEALDLPGFKLTLDGREWLEKELAPENGMRIFGSGRADLALKLAVAPDIEVDILGIGHFANRDFSAEAFRGTMDTDQFVETYDANVAFPGVRNLFMGDAADMVANLNGRNYVELGRGDDFFAGPGGGSTVYGGPGTDTLAGGDLPGELHGGEDADNIYSHNGQDRLFGEGGNDVFVVRVPADQTPAGLYVDGGHDAPDESNRLILDGGNYGDLFAVAHIANIQAIILGTQAPEGQVFQYTFYGSPHDGSSLQAFPVDIYPYNSSVKAELTLDVHTLRAQGVHDLTIVGQNPSAELRLNGFVLASDPKSSFKDYVPLDGPNDVHLLVHGIVTIIGVSEQS